MNLDHEADKIGKNEVEENGKSLANGIMVHLNATATVPVTAKCGPD